MVEDRGPLDLTRQLEEKNKEIADLQAKIGRSKSRSERS